MSARMRNHFRQNIVLQGTTIRSIHTWWDFTDSKSHQKNRFETNSVSETMSKNTRNEDSPRWVEPPVDPEFVRDFPRVGYPELSYGVRLQKCMISS